tara:strand:- start:854 stop:1204 length:351 start_codon:yes stop_codon:yes gene_type:complete
MLSERVNEQWTVKNTIHEKAFFACQGLTVPEVPVYGASGEVEELHSRELSNDEALEVLELIKDDTRGPASSIKEIMGMSLDYFGPGSELPYCFEGENGGEEKLREVSLNNIGINFY